MRELLTSTRNLLISYCRGYTWVKSQEVPKTPPRDLEQGDKQVATGSTSGVSQKPADEKV